MARTPHSPRPVVQVHTLHVHHRWHLLADCWDALDGLVLGTLTKPALEAAGNSVVEGTRRNKLIKQRYSVLLYVLTLFWVHVVTLCCRILRNGIVANIANLEKYQPYCLSRVWKACCIPIPLPLALNTPTTRAWFYFLIFFIVGSQTLR